MYTGIVDIGSNTIRLIIYNIDKDKNIEKIFSYKETAGLAGYVEKGLLNPNGIAILNRTLTQIKKITDDLSIPKVWYFATASLRNIDNSDAVLKIINDVLGIDIDIISNEDEGYLSYYAMKSLLNDKLNSENGIIADIGGGSSEIVIFKGNRIIENTSLPIGSLNLHSKFVKGIMPDKKEIKAIKDEINAHLSKIDNNDTFSELIGVGGTFRLIPELLENDNKMFTAHQLDNLIDCGKTDRNDLARLILKTKPERIHTALPGMMIAKEIMKKWNVSKVLTDRVSVRDGYLLRKINGGK